MVAGRGRPQQYKSRERLTSSRRREGLTEGANIDVLPVQRRGNDLFAIVHDDHRYQ